MEEADEAVFWLELLQEGDIFRTDKLQDLLQEGDIFRTDKLQDLLKEANELVAIFVSSVRAAKAASLRPQC